MKRSPGTVAAGTQALRQFMASVSQPLVQIVNVDPDGSNWGVGRGLAQQPQCQMVAAVIVSAIGAGLRRVIRGRWWWWDGYLLLGQCIA